MVPTRYITNMSICIFHVAINIRICSSRFITYYAPILQVKISINIEGYVLILIKKICLEMFSHSFTSCFTFKASDDKYNILV